MKHIPLTVVLGLLFCITSPADQPQTLFDGSSPGGSLDHWDFAPESWVIADDGSMTCQMEEAKAKNGTVRMKGKGYIWTKETYDDFKLTLSYKLSKTANSGVFFRTDKDNPVQGGFEIQLTDDEGFQKSRGKKDAKNLNGAFYDCQAATSNPSNPVGQWNDMNVTVRGSILKIKINDVLVNEADINKWDTPKTNPDGSANKFKTALKDLPKTGRIGFQNHGQVVWFKNVVIERL